MLNNNQDKTRKVYYSIGEVASMIGVSTSLLRFWEGEFPHIKPGNNSKGERRYKQNDIDNIKQIYSLVKEQGRTLQGAKDYIASNRPSRNLEMITGLERLKDFLLEIKSRLPN